MTTTWKALNGTPIPHHMLQGPGVIAEKGAKKSWVSETGDKYSKKKNDFWLQQTSHSGGDCMDKTCKKTKTAKIQAWKSEWHLMISEWGKVSSLQSGPCEAMYAPLDDPCTHWSTKQTPWTF